MKKLALLVCFVIAMAFTSTVPEAELFAVWHLKPDGDYKILMLNRQAALAHLAHHSGDWCHGGHCPNKN